jgi:hypothetical protein
VRTTLQIDDDVLDSARERAAAEGKSVGAVLSELARCMLRPTPIRIGADFPTFDVAPDAPPITPADVARARDEE